MVKTSEGLRTLLKTLFMSLGNIINTAALLMLILFTFSVAGMSLFGTIEFNDTINKIPPSYNNEKMCQHSKQLLEIKNNYKEYSKKRAN